MTKRSGKNFLTAAGVPLLLIAISFVALGGVASAHVVSSITADCYRVTAYFSDFPDTGVIVHLAADVNGQTTSTDVLVTNVTTQAHLDISAATAALVDAPVHIQVDATWTYLGPQHAHQSLRLTCGTPPTTSLITTPTQALATTTAAPPTTTTEASTTTAPQTTTSTEVRGTTISGTTTTETVRRQGATIVATTTTTPAVATLPRTGSDTTFPLVFGLSSLVAGALLLLRLRRDTGATDSR